MRARHFAIGIRAMRQLGVAVLGLSLVAGSASAQVREADERPPVHLIVGLDLSASNPLVDSSEYAAKVAARVADQIEDLPFKSILMVRTFGVYSGASNAMNFTVRISVNERPDENAQFFEALIAGIPKLVRDGRLQKQQRTNILPFLENMSEIVDCQVMDAVVILATDGIEDSERAQLIKPNSSLPMPVDRPFDGCSELQMLGVGQGGDSPSLTERLKKTWRNWALTAGFERFIGLNDW